MKITIYNLFKNYRRLHSNPCSPCAISSLYNLRSLFKCFKIFKEWKLMIGEMRIFWIKRNCKSINRFLNLRNTSQKVMPNLKRMKIIWDSIIKMILDLSLVSVSLNFKRFSVIIYKVITIYKYQLKKITKLKI